MTGQIDGILALGQNHFFGQIHIVHQGILRRHLKGRLTQVARQVGGDGAGIQPGVGIDGGIAVSALRLQDSAVNFGYVHSCVDLGALGQVADGDGLVIAVVNAGSQKLGVACNVKNAIIDTDRLRIILVTDGTAGDVQRTANIHVVTLAQHGIVVNGATSHIHRDRSGADPDAATRTGHLDCCPRGVLCNRMVSVDLTAAHIDGSAVRQNTGAVGTGVAGDLAAIHIEGTGRAGSAVPHAHTAAVILG